MAKQNKQEDIIELGTQDWTDDPTYSQRKQTAQQVNLVIKKQKKLLRQYLSLAQFKEPIMFLIRTTGEVEFYENVRDAQFIVPKTPGKVKKTIYLNERFLKTFRYGKHNFRGYICYEDESFPLPQNPLVYSEMLQLIVDKVLINFEKLKAALERERFKGISGAIISVAILVGVIGFVIWWIRKGNTGAAQAAAQVGAEVARNISNLTPQITVIQ